MLQNQSSSPCIPVIMPHLYDEDPRSTILIIPNPFLIVKPHRSTGVYLAGIFVSE